MEQSQHYKYISENHSENEMPKSLKLTSAATLIRSINSNITRLQPAVKYLT